MLLWQYPETMVIPLVWHINVWSCNSYFSYIYLSFCVASDKVVVLTSVFLMMEWRLVTSCRQMLYDTAYASTTTLWHYGKNLSPWRADVFLDIAGFARSLELSGIFKCHFQTSDNVGNLDKVVEMSWNVWNFDTMTQKKNHSLKKKNTKKNSK
jgi:hypothetical protein